MKKLIQFIAVSMVILGLSAIVGSDCPTLTEQASHVNFNIGSLMFFGIAGLWLIIKKVRGK